MENNTQQFVIDGNIMERYPDGHDPANAGSIDGNIFEDNQTTTEQETVYHWDSENRLTLIEQGVSKTGYLYNSSGIATVERNESGETVYISELSSIKNEQLFTKHIYVGTTRLASKLENWGYGSIDLEYEKVNTYYTHGDHLGSATLITNHRGEEYRRYLSSPYGETFVKQGDELNKIDYTFTGQRENEATGLIVFPARFYDPKVSRWLSVDPILHLYIDGAPAGGIYNSVNLNLYHYASNNPVVYNDPTGMVSDNTIMGHAGEQTMIQKLIQRGFIVADTGKHPNTTGPDIIAYKNGYLHIIDNKESMKAGKIIYRVKGFQKPELFNIWKTKAKSTILDSNLSQQQKRLMLSSLDDNKITLNVSTTGRNIKGIGPKLSRGVGGFRVGFIKGGLLSLYCVPFVTANLRINKIKGQLALIRSGDYGSKETQYRLTCIERYYNIEGFSFELSMMMGLANFDNAEQYINAIWQEKKYIVSHRMEDKIL